MPTWNYEVIHVYGHLVAHDDPVWLEQLVRRLTERHEARFAAPWSVDDAPADFIAGQLRAIVGIELRDHPDRGEVQAQPEPQRGRRGRGDRRAGGGITDGAGGRRADAIGAGVTGITTAEGTFTADVAGPDDGPTRAAAARLPAVAPYTWRSTVPCSPPPAAAPSPSTSAATAPACGPPDVEAYATPRLVADVIDVLDVLGVERVHLVGHDWGGQVAWLTAAAHPDRLATLTVLSRPHPAAFARSFELDEAQAHRSRHHRRMTDSVTDRWWADDCAGLRAMLTESGVPTGRRRRLRSPRSPSAAPLVAAMNWYRAAAQGLTVRDTPDVVVPTLYLWGDADQTVGRTAAELTAEHVSGPYRFVEIAGGGHFLTDDASNAVVERELLAHVRTGRPSD